jgi:FtsZ-interacting cell division protein ZipA
MDFDIGNLVYIILTLIFLIVGALGNKKKKANPQEFDTFDEDATEEQGPLESIEKRFSEIFEEDEKVREDETTRTEYRDYESREDVKTSEPSDYLIDTPYDKIDELPDEYNRVHKEKKEEDLYKLEDHIEEIARKTNIKMSTYKKKSPTFISEALKDFNPRKAYLYSEIFKPKYF